MLRNNKGNMFILTIVLMALVIFIAMVVIEWQRTVTIADNFDLEMSRALKSSIDLSLKDEYRKDGESVMDCDKAKLEFYNYLYGYMKLDENLKYYESGKFIYSVNIKNVKFISDPPEIFIDGNINVAALFFSIINPAYEINFSKGVHNMRLD